MVNPLIPAIEVWLAFWNNLPDAVRSLAYFALGLFVVLSCFRLLLNIRG